MEIILQATSEPIYNNTTSINFEVLLDRMPIQIL